MPAALFEKNNGMQRPLHTSSVENHERSTTLHEGFNSNPKSARSSSVEQGEEGVYGARSSNAEQGERTFKNISRNVGIPMSDKQRYEQILRDVTGPVRRIPDQTKGVLYYHTYQIQNAYSCSKGR